MQEQELVTVLAKALVEKPEEVQVEAVEEEDRTVLKLHVAQDDMGRVIGKQGRIAKAIRTIVKSAATREKKKVSVDIE
ncbi:MAG: KH domain-containing protein [Quinella sp. 1Q7]|nr:KH domain-containing protein [Quinella sp. 1Q7]MBR2733152.1 KH domain-containing protein [Selenomonadaceae bacterium]